MLSPPGGHGSGPPWRAVLYGAELHAESPVVVGPDLLQRQPRGHGQLPERLAGVLVRMLGANALAGCEPDRNAADLHHLPFAANQVHLDPAVAVVEYGAVSKLLK